MEQKDLSIIRRSCQAIQKLIIRIQPLIAAAMLLRSKAYREYRYRALALKKKLSTFHTQNAILLNEATLPECIGGSRCHTSHTEPFFYDTAYRVLPSDVILVPDERGIVINLNTVQPLSEKSKVVMWSCGRTCVVRQESIDKLMRFIQMTVAASEKQQYVIFQNIDVCNKKNQTVNANGSFSDVYPE